MSNGTEATILFADISGSTSLYDTLGDSAAHELVSETLRVLKGVAERHGGRVVKTIGDEVMCTFADAAAGATAACDMQDVIEERNDDNATGVVVSVRIGLQHGPAILEGTDVHGDSVNVAARMVAEAKARQIVLPRTTAESLPQGMARDTRFIDYATIKGKGEIELVELLWEAHDLTHMAGPPRGAGQVPGDRVVVHLECGSESIAFNDRRRAVVLGRKRTCDLTVDEPLASRQHARVERRHDRFFLIDQSTNGTYLRRAGEEARYLRREEWPLTGSGTIGLGRDPGDGAAEVIRYRIERG